MAPCLRWTVLECGNAHREGEERLQLLDGGEWRATKEAVDCEIVSFRMPRWSSPASTLAACIADHERAVRKKTVATWTRNCAALPCEPDVDAVDISDVEDRLEARLHRAGRAAAAPYESHRKHGVFLAVTLLTPPQPSGYRAARGQAQLEKPHAVPQRQPISSTRYELRVGRSDRHRPTLQ